MIPPPAQVPGRDPDPLLLQAIGEKPLDSGRAGGAVPWHCCQLCLASVFW